MGKILSKFVCLSHCGIGFVWFGLFFLPTTWWSDRISFHFFFSVTIIGYQFIWGAFIKLRTGKFRPTCFLTTVTQKLRGWTISDPRNYEYSFTREIFEKIGIALPQKAVRLLAFGIFTAAAIQYIFYRQLEGY